MSRAPSGSVLALAALAAAVAGIVVAAMGVTIRVRSCRWIAAVTARTGRTFSVIAEPEDAAGSWFGGAACLLVVTLAAIALGLMSA